MTPPAKIFAGLRPRHASACLAMLFIVILPALLLTVPSVGAQQQRPGADKVSAQVSALLARAQAEVSAQHYDPAIELYRNALAVDPENRQALGELAKTLETAGRWREALPVLQHLH